MDLKRAASSVESRKIKLSLESFPEEIIEHIFSFLPGKDAAATAVLSKTRQKYCPVLNLDSFYPHTSPQDFTKLVYHSLPMINPPIATPKTLRISAAFNFDDQDMNQWLQLKRIGKFTDVFLELRLHYCLPQTLFASKSLTVLHLKNCTLPDKIMSQRTTLDSLRELHLTYVHSAGELIRHLKYMCPLLVDLSIRVCKGINILRLSSLHDKLTNVKVKDYGDIKSIVINSPSLRIFKYCGSCQYEKGCRIDVNKCRNLEVLHLQLTPGVEGFKIVSPMLQILAIKVADDKFVLDSAIHTPNLQSFTYSNSSFLPTLVSSAFPAMSSTPQEIKIKLNTPYSHVGISWFRQLRNCIGKLSSNVIKLSVEINAPMVTFENDEEVTSDASIHSPVPCVNVLKIKMCSGQENFSTLIDGLLWSCRPKTLSIPRCNHGNKRELVEALCHEFLNMEAKQNCCRSDHTRCWRHYLKDVEIKQLFGAKFLKTNFYMKW